VKALTVSLSDSFILIIVSSKFLCRKRKSNYLFDLRKHIQNSTLQVYYSRNRLLDSFKILTITQLYILYNLCVISRYKTQLCIVALRILKCCSKCFLTQNSNNSKNFFCKFFFFQKTCRTKQHLIASLELTLTHIYISQNYAEVVEHIKLC
jgi:hypothetical protein